MQRKFIQALINNADNIFTLISIGILSEDDIYNGLVGDLIECIQEVCEDAGFDRIIS